MARVTASPLSFIYSVRSSSSPQADFSSCPRCVLHAANRTFSGPLPPLLAPPPTVCSFLTAGVLPAWTPSLPLRAQLPQHGPAPCASYHAIVRVRFSPVPFPPIAWSPRVWCVRPRIAAQPNWYSAPVSSPSTATFSCARAHATHVPFS